MLNGKGFRFILSLLVVCLFSFTVSSLTFGANASIWDAARSGDLKTVKTQIEKIGVDVNAEDGFGTTPIVWAVTGGFPDVVDYLIQKGANLKVVVKNTGGFGFDGPESDCDLIQYATNTWRRYNTVVNHAKVIRVLMAANQKNSLGLKLPKVDSLDLAVIVDDLELVKGFIKAGNNITKSTIPYCIAFDNAKMLQFFDEIDFIKQDDSKDYYALYFIEALNQNASQCINFFLNKGVNLNSPAVFFAVVKAGNMDLFQNLLAKGFDLKTNNEQGINALHIAAANNRLEMAKIILEKGINVNIKASSNYIPFHAAAENGHLEMVKFLVEKGAKVGASTNGSNAYDLAVRYKHDEVAAYLKPLIAAYYDNLTK